MESSSSLPSNLPSDFGDGMRAESEALVRVLAYPSGSVNRQRRQRVPNMPSLGRQLSRQNSFCRGFGHAAAETYLLIRLSFKLLSYLGLGYRWITKLLALALYATLLLPGFLQVVFLYYFSNHVKRSIIYGDQPRNRLDLYLPANCDGLHPVVIFITGGAWTIGYKAWGSLLGLQLAERNIIVACIDYRNFPQGTISDMVNDVSQGIAYIFENIIELGGDLDRIYLMGQSAGAHISACALLHQAVKESRGENIRWSTSRINTYFGLSGGYNLLNLVDHFHNRGLYRSIFLSIMEGEESLELFSPEILVQDPNFTTTISLLPHIVLFHGTLDYTIPSDASKKFVDALQRAGAHADLILYEGKTHTDLFVQDPLRGGRDELFDYIVAFIHNDNEEELAMDAMAPPRKRFVPEILLRLAGKVSPF